MKTIWTSFWDLLAKFAIVAALLTLFSVSISIRSIIPKDAVALVFAICISITNFLCICYIVVISLRKKHRYCFTIPHIHAFHHELRNWSCTLSRRYSRHRNTDAFKEDFGTTTRDLLEQVAEAFTQICNRRCSTCIKEMLPDSADSTRVRLRIVARNRTVSDSRGQYDRGATPHLIECDTPCDDIYHSRNRRSYALYNNVPAEYAAGRYKSPWFQPPFSVKPEISKLGFFRYIQYWPLLYSSCLVVPIRSKPTLPSGIPTMLYWGFLCVDCRSRNVFDRDQAWELAASFADALYVHFSISFGKIETKTVASPPLQP